MTDQTGVWLIGCNLIDAEIVPEMADAIIQESILVPSAGHFETRERHEYPDQQAYQ